MKIRPVTWTALGLGLLAVGCWSSESRSARTYYADRWWSDSGVSYAVAEPQVEQPELTLSDGTVERALRGNELLSGARRRALAERLTARATAELDTSAAAEEVRACYREGQRDLAQELVRARPDLYGWEEAGAVVAIDCRFASSGSGGAIELTLERRAGVEGDLAVCLPPGTYGEPEGEEPTAAEALAELDERPWTRPEQDRRYGRWPRPQDLAFLRAPVIELPGGVARAVVEVPVACASFHKGAPESGTPYRLATFPAGSSIDRLMVALCAREAAPAAPEAQLAVWMARDELSWEAFVAEGGHTGRLVTFSGSRRVLPRHAQGAAQLLLEGGIDPRRSRFFRGAAAAPEEPADAEAPVEEPPSATPREPAEEPAAAGLS